MDGALWVDAAAGRSVFVFQRLASESDIEHVRCQALLVLDLRLDRLDGVSRLDVQRDGGSRRNLDKDLECLRTPARLPEVPCSLVRRRFGRRLTLRLCLLSHSRRAGSRVLASRATWCERHLHLVACSVLLGAHLLRRTVLILTRRRHGRADGSWMERGLRLQSLRLLLLFPCAARVSALIMLATFGKQRERERD
jgi:hypothetical protein